MKYLVTVAMQDGKEATVSVVALNQADAKYRAMAKIESRNNGLTSHVVVCRRTG